MRRRLCASKQPGGHVNTGGDASLSVTTNKHTRPRAHLSTGGVGSRSMSVNCSRTGQQHGSSGDSARCCGDTCVCVRVQMVAVVWRARELGLRELRCVHQRHTVVVTALAATEASGLTQHASTHLHLGVAGRVGAGAAVAGDEP
jgi:hypothetical protein